MSYSRSLISQKNVPSSPDDLIHEVTSSNFDIVEKLDLSLQYETFSSENDVRKPIMNQYQTNLSIGSRELPVSLFQSKIFSYTLLSMVTEVKNCLLGWCLTVVVVTLRVTTDRNRSCPDYHSTRQWLDRK